MWIWEGYFHLNRKEQWISAADKFRHINTHVIQDIEDSILLEGFKGKKPIEIKKIIDQDLHGKRSKKKNRNKEEEEEEKLEDKRRDFLNNMRPPNVWNFFEDSEIVKTPHLLRPDA